VNLETVLGLAEHFSVLALRPGRKDPIGKHGVKESTQDVALIKAIHRQYPRANWGIHPAVTGQIVVDVDLGEGQERHPIEDRLTPTFTVKTPKGRHYYYSVPVGAPQSLLRPTQSKIADHVDTRCKDSYVVSPFSVVGGKEYLPEQDELVFAEVPEWIVELFRAADLKRHSAVSSAVSSAIGGAVGTAVLEHARKYVAAMPPAIQGSAGSVATLAVARVLQNGFALQRSDVERLLGEYNQRCLPPWSERELEHKVDDVFNKPDPQGLPYGHLIYSDERQEVDTSVLDGIDLVALFAPKEKNPPKEAGPQQRRNRESEPQQAWLPASSTITKWYAQSKHPDIRYWRLLDRFCLLDEGVALWADWQFKQSTYVQPAFVLATFLTFCSTAAARWREGPTGLQSQVWCLAIADSTAGKNVGLQSLSEALNLLGLEEERAHKTEAALAAGLELACAVNLPKVFVIDEYADLLQSIALPGHGQTLKRLLTEFATNNGKTYNLATSMTQNKGQAIKLNAPAICCYSATNPDATRAVFKRFGTSDGFLGRHVFFNALDEKMHRLLEVDGASVAPLEEQTALCERIARVRTALTEWRNRMPATPALTRTEQPIYLYKPDRIAHGEGIRERLKAYREETRARGATDGVDKNLCGRLAEQAERLALGLHLWVDPSSTELTLQLLDLCIAVVEEGYRTITRVLLEDDSVIDGRDEDEKCKRVLAALRSRSGNTCTDVPWAQIVASTRRVGPRKVLIEVLERLEQEGKVCKGLGVGGCLPWSLTLAGLAK